MTVKRTPEEVETLLMAAFPADDREDIECYVWGPDDPEDYFSKFGEDAGEITDDYREFREKQ
jgi:hypothetical protein